MRQNIRFDADHEQAVNAVKITAEVRMHATAFVNRGLPPEALMEVMRHEQQRLADSICWLVYGDVRRDLHEIKTLVRRLVATHGPQQITLAMEVNDKISQLQERLG